MDQLLSVIIPIYNSEKYLNRCLDSIQKQTYQNLEIIMIDDGSTDSSSTICKTFCENDNRFKYFFQSNSGVSVARNKGISESTGDLIAFVDSDDWLSCDMYEELVCALRKFDSDIVLCDEIETNGVLSNIYTFPNIEAGNYQTNGIDINVLNEFAGAVWKCIFKKELFKRDTLFPTGIPLSEDKIFCLNIFANSRNIYYVKSTLYYRYLRMDSASHVCRKNQKEIQLMVLNALENVLSSKWPDIYMEIAYYYLATNIFLILSSIAENEKKFSHKRKEIREFCELPEVRNAILKTNFSSKLIKCIKKRYYYFITLYLMLNKKNNIPKEKMKSILLVTLQSDNFGNRLQNYALQYQLEQMDCTVSNLVVKNPNNYSVTIQLKLKVKEILGLLGIRKFEKYKLDYTRHRIFNQFNKDIIHNRIYVNKYNSHVKKDGYDFAITGSDQVWHNWTRTKEELQYYYLTFIECHKRVAYAASYGIELEELPDQKLHAQCLEEMEYISCREKSACDIVKTLSSKQANLVLDPTLLLTRNTWAGFEKKPEISPNQKYIFVYMLGEKTDSYINCLNSLLNADETIEIIDIMDESEKWYMSSPREFIWLIHNAEHIITDSFHAVVFSLIFHKSFFVFRRYYSGVEDKMFDRIQTLLGAVNAESCIYSIDTSSNSYDFKTVDENINMLKQKSIEYLNNVLKMN